MAEVLSVVKGVFFPSVRYEGPLRPSLALPRVPLLSLLDLTDLDVMSSTLIPFAPDLTPGIRDPNFSFAHLADPRGAPHSLETVLASPP